MSSASVSHQHHNTMLAATNPNFNHHPLIAIVLTTSNINLEQSQLAIKDLITSKYPIDMPDRHGKTAIHYAVVHSKIELVNQLIDYGANINIQDNQGNAALHYACIRCPLIIIKLLVENGAFLLQTNKLGDIPMHLACLHKRGMSVYCYLLNQEEVAIENGRVYPKMQLNYQNNSNMSPVQYLKDLDVASKLIASDY
ncbi:Hypothetical protein MVR_LOCUS93 [uncultured virus]|nr:Hypothetical protein MVR_LOCUS93 [uncultured virus]